METKKKTKKLMSKKDFDNWIDYFKTDPFFVKWKNGEYCCPICGIALRKIKEYTYKVQCEHGTGTELSVG